MGKPSLANEAEQKRTVYLVNSDTESCSRIAALLAQDNYDVRIFSSAKHILSELAPPHESVMIIDDTLDDMAGVSLVKQLHDRGLQLPTIMTTDASNIPNTVSAIREGVIDVIEEPLNVQRLTQSIRRALKSVDRGR